MKIAFVHLSDIHFIDKDTGSAKHVDRIIRALNQLPQFDHLFYIVSGDIAYSGQSNEYKNAAHFFSNLKQGAAEKFVLKAPPTFQIVSGNHDVLLDEAFDHHALQEIYRKGEQNNHIVSEQEKQSAFYQFSRMFGCSDLSRKLLYTKKYVLGDYSVEFNLINSAIFSMFDQEKGMHFLPSSVIETLKQPAESDLVVSVMHHSFHWFNDQQKLLLENALLSQSDMIFLGHEHYIGHQSIAPGLAPSTHVFAGGELGNKNDWSNSTFSVCLFETRDRSIERTSFSWNEKSSVYVSCGINTLILPSHRTKNIPLVVNDSFKKRLFVDDKNSISESLKDYYVFPRLRQRKSGEYTDEKEYIESDAFTNCILENKHVYIVGVDNSGKTSLLKHIFESLSCKMCVLFCDVESITSGNRRRIVKSVFEDKIGHFHRCLAGRAQR